MDDKLELKEGDIWILRDIKNVFQELYDHYRKVEKQNEYLREENARIKSETYKDEELSKMGTEYERMKVEYYRGFPISEVEDEKIKKWMENLLENDPEMKMTTIGGRFHYEFTQTGIGTIGTVVDSYTHKSFTFRELN